MPENAVPAQPDAEQIVAWLSEQDPNSAWLAEQTADGVRLQAADRFGIPSVSALRIAASWAATNLEGARCPWPVAVERDGAVLVVRSISEEEAEQRREARQAARAERRARAAETATLLDQEARVRRRVHQDGLAEREIEVAAWKGRHATDRSPQRVDVAALPALAYAHSPGHYHGWTEPERFRPLGPDPVTRGVMPQRGAGLWTSPVLESDPATGEVLRTVWSSYWVQAGRDPERYSEHRRIVPNPDARIVRVNDLEDLRALVQAYPNPIGLDEDQHRFPDWPRLAQDWDAVYLTANGASETARTPDGDEPHLEGWECETVVWLRPAYTVADGLGL
ncbi:hypothetical protein ACIG3E_33415 [Streptomyces sp. NPDC053474]|uniref:hypothetical protein n=1 Tax=Streptomyces sp. NPDC053474 TaxID=3365704 RepID=UPI0037D423F5